MWGYIQKFRITENRRASHNDKQRSSRDVACVHCMIPTYCFSVEFFNTWKNRISHAYVIESTRGPRSESYRVWLHVSDVNAAVRALRLTYTLVPRFWVTDGEEKRLGLFVILSLCCSALWKNK
jgi:hypothetical protein